MRSGFLVSRSWSRIGLIAGVCGVWLVGGCTGEATTASSEPVAVSPAEQTMQDGDGEVYASLRDLADNSDLVVVATVGEVVARQMEGGPEELVVDTDTGMSSAQPMILHDVTVTDQIRGSADHDAGTILVATFDDGVTETPDQSDSLKPGSTVVLFLQHQDREDGSGSDSVESFAVPTGGAQGILDVSEGSARARVTSLTHIKPDQVLDRGVGDRAVIALDALIAALAES